MQLTSNGRKSKHTGCFCCRRSGSKEHDSNGAQPTQQARKWTSLNRSAVANTSFGSSPSNGGVSAAADGRPSVPLTANMVYAAADGPSSVRDDYAVHTSDYIGDGNIVPSSGGGAPVYAIPFEPADGGNNPLVARPAEADYSSALTYPLPAEGGGSGNASVARPAEGDYSTYALPAEGGGNGNTLVARPA